MKKILISLMVFGLCAPQMHAMQMGNANKQSSKSSSTTCGNAVKTCCYLSAALCLMTSAPLVNAHPDDIACYKVFAHEESDKQAAENIAFYKIITMSDYRTEQAWQESIERINKRNEQRKDCALRMKASRRKFCNKRDDLRSWLDDYQAWDRLAEEEKRLGDNHAHVVEERERLEANYYLRKECLALLKEDQADDDYTW